MSVQSNMIEISLKMLRHNRSRFFAALGGTAALFFLCAAQVGLLVGWCNTTSAIIRHADADLWIMARQTPAGSTRPPWPRQRCPAS